MQDLDHEAPSGVIVPVDSLKPDVLRQVVIDILLREEGNDVSASDLSERHVESVIQGLRKGSYLLTFDQATETVGIISSQDKPTP